MIYNFKYSLISIITFNIILQTLRIYQYSFINYNNSVFLIIPISIVLIAVILFKFKYKIAWYFFTIQSTFHFFDSSIITYQYLNYNLTKNLYPYYLDLIIMIISIFISILLLKKSILNDFGLKNKSIIISLLISLVLFIRSNFFRL